MKTLYVVRHAKSSWSDALLDDFLRPLNDRGKRNAPEMAYRLLKNKAAIELFLSSPAKRALDTAKRMAKVLNYKEEKIETDRNLYHASPATMLKILKKVNDKTDVVMLFGHNPGLTEFVNELMNEEIGNVPTCGVVACTLEVKQWRDVEWGKGKLFMFDYPKKFV